jgi:hypothetical protein
MHQSKDVQQMLEEFEQRLQVLLDTTECRDRVLQIIQHYLIMHMSTEISIVPAYAFPAHPRIAYETKPLIVQIFISGGAGPALATLRLRQQSQPLGACLEITTAQRVDVMGDNVQAQSDVARAEWLVTLPCSLNIFIGMYSSTKLQSKPPKLDKFVLDVAADGFRTASSPVIQVMTDRTYRNHAMSTPDPNMSQQPLALPPPISQPIVQNLVHLADQPLDQLAQVTIEPMNQQLDQVDNQPVSDQLFYQICRQANCCVNKFLASELTATVWVRARFLGARLPTRL